VLVTIKPGEVRARDLQSSNGTYLNGERLTTERLLNDGDRITIGETDIFVRITAPAMEEVGATVRLDTAKLQCPACGAELPLHAEFCARCGYRLGGEVAGDAGGYAPAPPPRPASTPPPVPPAPLAAAPSPRTEAYPQEALGVPPPPPPPRSPRLAQEPSGAELLPPIADEVFHSGAAGRGPAPRPALPQTPPPPMAPAAPGRPVAPAVAAAPAPYAAAAPAAGARPGGVLLRWLALMIDGIWMLPLIVGPTVLLVGLSNLQSPTTSAYASLCWVLVQLFLVVPCWAFFGATPGKALLGLRIIGGRRRRGIGLGLAFLRLCGWMVSAATFGIGFLVAAFAKDKRALHDHLAGTQVIRR
jgi:pSer/pThr/pTyr-binding forkhead associated (FHA) protein/uncharacterized RDD family membrane protein YckC